MVSLSITNDSTLESLVEQLGKSEKPDAPLEKWNPPYCGDMPLKIDAQGVWWHDGQLIRREKMIALFARILWREDSQYFLKTPVEKVSIVVEDVPLLVNKQEDYYQNGKKFITLGTVQGDVVIVGPEHVPFMRVYAGVNRPYIRIRRNLEALINRNTFYHLIEQGDFFEDELGRVGAKIKSGDFEFILLAP